MDTTSPKQASMVPDAPQEQERRSARKAKGPSAGPSRAGARQLSMSDSFLRPLTERIEAMEKELLERLDLLCENRKISEELRRKEGEIARKEVEIETLKRDLVYQKRLLEKEIEDRMRSLDEKWALMDREVAERVARERDEFENRLARERSIWSERLVREQEKYAAGLAELQTKEGFWARLVRMLTWS